MDGPQIFQGLLDRGYGPVQAAAIAGNILQESGGDPNAVNGGEGANGLLQWRNERWQGLRDFAAARGASPNAVGVQLDYIGTELGGSERRNAPAFLNAPDLAAANAALKKYIRYGDDSEGTRLRYASRLLNQQGTPSAPLSMAGPPIAQQPQVAQGEPAQPTVQARPQPAAPAEESPMDMAALSQTPQLAPLLLPQRPRINLAQAYAKRV